MPHDSNHARKGGIGSEDDALERARKQLESALRSSDDTILLQGASDGSKLVLLDSIWKRPPRGFAPIPVPCRGASADDIAATILAALRTVPVSDADAALARMMRTQSLRGMRPVLMLDDLEAIPLAALERLCSIAGGSRVAVRWIAGGSGSPASQSALAILPGPVRVVAVDALPSARRKSESAIPPPKAAEIARKLASSEPARPAAAPSQPVEAALRPVRAGAIASRSPMRRTDLPRPRAHTQRQVLPPRASRAIAAAIIGCAALWLLVDRAPPLVAWVTDATGASAAVARDWAAPSVHDATAFAVESWNSLTGEPEAEPEIPAPSPREEPEPPPAAAQQPPPPAQVAVEEPAPPPTPAVSAEPPADPAPRTTAHVAPKPVPAPAVKMVEVGINSNPWANVAVDGVDYGSTPISIELPPGPHLFQAQLSDGRVLEREIEVTAGEGRNQIAFY